MPLSINRPPLPAAAVQELNSQPPAGPLSVNVRHRRRRQGGQSMIEYTIICAVLVACLLVPIPPNGKTAARDLTDAIRGFYTYLTFYISLP